MREASSGGVREVLRVAAPLVAAASGHAVRLFCDRMMLSWYSADAIKASLPAGMTAFTMMTFFFGIATYAGTFVAQYTGAGRSDRAGRAVWQGLYVALVGGVAVAATTYWAPEIFAVVGHAPEVRDDQVIYYTLLAGFAVFPLAGMALHSFWSGRGLTWMVMLLELGVAAVNVALNYCLIFGAGPLPPLGIFGAGVATVTAAGLGTGVAFLLFVRRRNRESFGTWPRRTFDPALLRRLIRYGLPNGVQMLLDLASFNTFVILIGRVGGAAQEAATLAFTMNGIAFIPMIGIGMATSILVGQAVGAEDIPHAERCVVSARRLVLLYMGAMGLSFVVVPEFYLQAFVRPDDPAQAEVLQLAARIMRYVAAYLIFDGLFVLYSGALKGAGDTRFAMWMMVAMSWALFAVPCLLVYRLMGPELETFWTLWRIFVGYIILAGVVFYLRYRQGRWKSMRVIEATDELATSPLADDLIPGAEVLGEP